MKKINTYLFALFLMSNIAYGDTLIHAGKVIDGISDAVIENVTIRIEGSRIQNIESGFTDPDPNDILIDLKDQTVLPGLIDTHVHLTGEYNENSRLKRFISNEADYALDSALYAKKTLEAGFTVVRNLGDTYNVTIALNKAIKSNTVPGPMIFTAGKTLSSTGGHGDPTNGWAKIIMGDPGPNEGIVNGVEDARKAVRQRYKDGADWIKITATGGVLDISKSDANPQFTNEEIKEITKTASDYGLKVAAHAHGDEGMYRAVSNGVKTIEHGTLIKERTMALMISKGAYLVPTISAGKFVAKMAEKPNFFHPEIAKKAMNIGPQIQNTFKRAYKYGVPISFGTDSGVSPHGDNAKEFIYMNEAGMPINEVLQTATLINAKILDMENSLGQIETGYIADIVATDKNALDDINTLMNVSFVMKNGKIYKNNFK